MTNGRPAMTRAGMIDLLVRRPILAFVINLLIVIAGGVALFGVDVREMPQIDRPVLSVRSTYEGVAPEIVERQVTTVLEDALSRLEGLQGLSWTSGFESSRIIVDLQDGADVDAATNAAREIVSQAMRRLPEGMEEPTVSQNDADADPIIRLAMSGDATIPELTSLAEELVAERLSAIDGVAEVTVTGNQIRQFRIEVDMTSLYSRGLSMEDLSAALQGLRDDTPLGALDTGIETLALRAADPEASVEGSRRPGSTGPLACPTWPSSSSRRASGPRPPISTASRPWASTSSGSRSATP